VFAYHITIQASPESDGDRECQTGSLLVACISCRRWNLSHTESLYDQHWTDDHYQFGEYVQTHEEHDNTMATRTVGALALRPTRNIQGSYYFLSFDTGRDINQTHATPLPMPNEVLDRVHRMARQQKAQPRLVFMDRHRQVVIDNDHDGDDDVVPDIDDGGDIQHGDDIDNDDDDESYHPGDEDNDEDDDDDNLVNDQGAEDNPGVAMVDHEDDNDQDHAPGADPDEDDNAMDENAGVDEDIDDHEANTGVDGDGALRYKIQIEKMKGKIVR
jgi:hypothetical protein